MKHYGQPFVGISYLSSFLHAEMRYGLRFCASQPAMPPQRFRQPAAGEGQLEIRRIATEEALCMKVATQL